MADAKDRFASLFFSRKLHGSRKQYYHYQDPNRDKGMGMPGMQPLISDPKVQTV